MSKIYLLGGENIALRDGLKVNRSAFNAAGESPNILVFSWARASFDKAYERRKMIFDYFRSLGASTVNLVDYSDNLEEINRKLAESNLVYLTGGIPSVLIERLRKMGVDGLLRRYGGVIVGRSAGALVLCRKCVISYRSNSAVKVLHGLGLVDLTLKAHYKPENDNELLLLSKEEKVYAVPKGSALVYDNGALSFINNVYLFENGERRTLG